MSRQRGKVFRRLLLGLVGVTAVVVLWGVMDAYEGAAGTGSWNVRWQSRNGRELGGYLVYPEDAIRYLGGTGPGTASPAVRSSDGRFPAVLLLHEWWGLGNETVVMADYLASEGYVVLAPDLLRGNLAVSVPGALFLIATNSQRRIAADLDDARSFLAGIPDVDVDRIGVVGFCFGGTHAMLAGARWQNNGATVILYGGGPIAEAEDIGNLGLNAPLLGIYGSEDRTISIEDIETFEALLADRDARISIYDGVGHAFVDPESIRRPGPPADAWFAVREFLRTEL